MEDYRARTPQADQGDEHWKISFCPLYKMYECETVTVQRGVKVWMQIFKDIFIETFKKKNGDFPQSNKVDSPPTSP